MVHFGINGACGQMGRRLIGLLAEEEDCSLAWAAERADHPDLGRDAGVVAGLGELGVAVKDSVAAADRKPDVVLDFSAPAGIATRAQACAELGAALVIGTTGLDAESLRVIEVDIAARIPVLVAPNMSFGVNLLCGVVGKVAKALGEGYDIEIVEMHHRRKKDAPSGTALKLAHSICDALSWDPEQVLAFGREGMVGERPARQLAIHAVRGGDVVGDHTTIFSAPGERIEITHRVSNRDVFARGAIRVGQALAGRPAGLYSMQDVLG